MAQEAVLALFNLSTVVSQGISLFEASCLWCYIVQAGRIFHWLWAEIKKGSLKYIQVIIPGCCKHSVSCLDNAHFIWTICCRHIAAQSLLQLQAGLRCRCLKYLQIYPLSTLHTRWQIDTNGGMKIWKCREWLQFGKRPTAFPVTRISLQDMQQTCFMLSHATDLAFLVACKARISYLYNVREYYLY